LGVHVIVSPCWLVIGCRTHSAALVPYTTLFRSETVVKAGMKLTTRKKRGEGGKEVLGPNEPGPGDCVSILEPATKAELAGLADLDRKSTRLNSSHEWSSDADFSLKKKPPRAHQA